MSYHVLDHVLGSVGRVRCMRHLLLYSVERTALALSKEIRFSHRATSMALASLAEAGLVKIKSAGRARLYEAIMTRKLNSDVLLPLFRREKEMMADIVGRIVRVFKAPPISILLYGSRARGDARPGSDLDLFAIVSTSSHGDIESNLDKASEAVEKLYGMRLDLLVETPQALAKIKRRQAPLWKSLKSDAEVLYGRPIEEVVA